MLLLDRDLIYGIGVYMSICVLSRIRLFVSFYQIILDIFLKSVIRLYCCLSVAIS